MSLTANLDWPLQQLDAKNAFLNGDSEEEVYMDAPPGFVSHFNKKKYVGFKSLSMDWNNNLELGLRDLPSLLQRFGFSVVYQNYKELVVPTSTLWIWL